MARERFLLETLEDIGGPPPQYYHFRMPDCPFHYSIFWESSWLRRSYPRRSGNGRTACRIIHLRRTGSVALYTQLLGHGDYLADGIMFHLHLEIVKWILDDNNPYGQGLEHLVYGRYYDGGAGGSHGGKKQASNPLILCMPIEGRVQMDQEDNPEKKLTIFITIDTEDAYFTTPRLITGRVCRKSRVLEK